MVVVAPLQTRQAGLLDSGTQDLATLLGVPMIPNTEYIATILLNQADLIDATVVLGQVTLYIDGQIKSGPIDMQCGILNKNGVVDAPHISWGNSELTAANVRVTLVLPKRMAAGCDVTSRPMVQ